MDDTIVAISTPLGEGGIGIVRFSGKDSIKIASKMFKPTSKQDIQKSETHTVHYGYIVNPASGQKVDEVLLTIMRFPKTYTRENVIEIGCHGGIIPLRRILELAMNLGARLAEPGEFTKRAFLNGRIDLTQAEAVIDVIRSKTEINLKIAVGQLRGDLSEEITNLREDIISVLVSVEAAIDFPEEEMEIISADEMLKQVYIILGKVNQLIETADEGKIIKEGVKTVIVGKPNVGKSSLLNALLKESRAIVTPIPGTTRDIIEEYINIEGIPFKIVDTAGMRETRDVVEIEGVKRTEKSLDEADLVLFVLDAAEKLSKEDRAIIAKVKNKKTIVLINKSDLPELIEIKELKEELHDKNIMKISALTQKGLNQLKKNMVNMILSKHISLTDGIMITNVRHKGILIKARESIEKVIETIKKGLSGEFIAVDLQGALSNLGEIVGETTTEDILEQIFNRFCVGK